MLRWKHIAQLEKRLYHQIFPSQFLPPANEVWGKVICLQACFCSQGGVPDHVPPPRTRYTPPWEQTPQEQTPREQTPPRCPPGADAPQRRHQPPRSRHHLPRADTPRSRHPPPEQTTPPEQKPPE